MKYMRRIKHWHLERGRVSIGLDTIIIFYFYLVHLVLFYLTDLFFFCCSCPLTFLISIFIEGPAEIKKYKGISVEKKNQLVSLLNLTDNLWSRPTRCHKKNCDNMAGGGDKAGCILPLPDPSLCFTALCVSHPWTLFIHPLTWRHPAC